MIMFAFLDLVDRPWKGDVKWHIGVRIVDIVGVQNVVEGRGSDQLETKAFPTGQWRYVPNKYVLYLSRLFPKSGNLPF